MKIEKQHHSSQKPPGSHKSENTHSGLKNVYQKTGLV